MQNLKNQKKEKEGPFDKTKFYTLLSEMIKMEGEIEEFKSQLSKKPHFNLNMIFSIFKTNDAVSVV